MTETAYQNTMLNVTGKVSGLTFSAQVENGTSVGSIATFGKGGIDIKLDASGHESLYLYQGQFHTKAASGAASVGDLTIAHVNVSGASNVSASVRHATSGSFESQVRWRRVYTRVDLRMCCTVSSQPTPSVR